MSLTSLVQGPIFLFLKGTDRIKFKFAQNFISSTTVLHFFPCTIVSANSGTFLFPDNYFLFVDIRFIGQSEGGSKRADGPKIEN